MVEAMREGPAERHLVAEGLPWLVAALGLTLVMTRLELHCLAKSPDAL